MINERVLNIVSAVTVLFMMAAICWRLADQFDPKYMYSPPGQRYTNTAYEKLEYQNAEYKHRWLNAEKAIEEIAR